MRPTKEQQLKNELDWKCSILKELLQDEEACRRYEEYSRMENKMITKEEPAVFVDFRGVTRYVRQNNVHDSKCYQGRS